MFEILAFDNWCVRIAFENLLGRIVWEEIVWNPSEIIFCNILKPSLSLLKIKFWKKKNQIKFDKIF